MKKARAVFLLIGCLAIAPVAARAGDPVPTKVNVQLRDTPFRAAVERLFQGTGRTYRVEPDVPDTPVTLNVQAADIDVAVRLVSRLANVGTRTEGATTVFFKKAEPQAFRPPVVEVNPLPSPAPRGRASEEWIRIPLRFASVDVLAAVLGGAVLPTEADLQLGTRGAGGGFGGYNSGGYLSGYGSQGGFGGLGGRVGGHGVPGNGGWIGGPFSLSPLTGRGPG